MYNIETVITSTNNYFYNSFFISVQLKKLWHLRPLTTTIFTIREVALLFKEGTMYKIIFKVIIPMSPTQKDNPFKNNVRSST
jgi:hypothetical protein